MKSNKKCLYATRKHASSANPREMSVCGSRLDCHTEILSKTEVFKNTKLSKGASTDVQNHLDISVSVKPQYDKNRQ